MKKDLRKQNNHAFIDGQNLHLGTQEDGWFVDLVRFRTYLQKKYSVTEAYYFLGFVNEEHSDLYSSIQKAGFILIFREHHLLLGKKKGNVDADIVFEVMKSMIDNKDLDKVVLVSGDGDYKKLVDYLVLKNKFEKILFPNRKYASSLYKKLGAQYFAHLGEEDVKRKIGRRDKKKRAP